MKRFLTLLTISPIVVLSTSTTISCGENISSDHFQFFKVENDSSDIDNNAVNIIENSLRDYINEFTEAQALKSIHIFDSSNAPIKDDEGDYVNESEEIIINTSIMSKYKNFTIEDKANYLMQLIAHEYNHYVDHSYLLGIDKSSSVVDLSIHDWNNGGAIQPWPKLFLDTFKKELNYTNDTKLYDDIEVAPGLKSIGSIYNQKNLFDMANGVENPYQKDFYDTKDRVMAPINPKIDTSRVLADGSLAYLYSMDELFARKMQIATSIYRQTSNFDDEGYFINMYGEKLQSPYLQDVVNYQRGLNDYGNNGQYLYDKPNQKIADLYDEARGLNDSSISFAEVSNNKHILSNGLFEGNINRSLIRFGGALEDSSKLKYVGYIDNSHFVNIPISIITRTDSGVKNDYLTSFIQANDIIGKQLYFAESNNGKNKIAINSTRNTDFGLVTTHRYLDKPEDVNYSFDLNAKLQTL